MRPWLPSTINRDSLLANSILTEDSALSALWDRCCSRTVRPAHIEMIKI